MSAQLNPTTGAVIATALAGRQMDELYDLKADLSETKDVLTPNTALAAKMKKLLAEARDNGYTRLGAEN